MANDEAVELLFESAHGKTTPGKGVLKTFSHSEAVKKGGGWCLACWFLAFVGIFIPIVHFIVVPLCLIAGPGIGFMIFKMHDGKTDLEHGKGACPECGAPQELTQAVDAWPLTGICSDCKNSYAVKRA